MMHTRARALSSTAPSNGATKCFLRSSSLRSSMLFLTQTFMRTFLHCFFTGACNWMICRSFAVKSGADGFLDIARATFCRLTEDIHVLKARYQDQHNLPGLKVCFNLAAAACSTRSLAGLIKFACCSDMLYLCTQ